MIEHEEMVVEVKVYLRHYFNDSRSIQSLYNVKATYPVNRFCFETLRP